MIPKLSDELVESKTETIFKDFRRIGEKYWGGYLTEETAFQEIVRRFNDVFPKLFSDNHLKLCLNDTNYPIFVKEYENYKTGSESKDESHIPWLFDVSDEQCEATESDQRKFFDLMTRFLVTPDYFEPYPDDKSSPNVVPIHQYRDSGVYGIRFNCIDDGGLLADESPVGKTYTLMNDMGQEAVLTIKEDRRGIDRNDLDFDEIVTATEQGLIVVKAEFLAEGFIEGYTAREREQNAEVLIRLKDRGTKIYWLAYWQDSNDSKAFFEYPMWQDWFGWCEEKDMKLRRILSSILKSYHI